MQYVVVEYFGEPTLVTDKQGKVKMFDNTTDAIEEARDCENGVVVPLSVHLIDTVGEAYSYVSYGNFAMKDEDRDTELEGELQALLGIDE